MGLLNLKTKTKTNQKPQTAPKQGLDKIIEKNVSGFILPPPSTSSFAWGYQMSLRLKIVYLCRLEGGDSSHHSPLLKPPTSSSGLSPGTLERWFVSRAPHWAAVFPSRVENPGSFQPQCEVPLGHQEMLTDYLRKSPCFCIQDSPKSPL